VTARPPSFSGAAGGKGGVGKSKEEVALEKRRELERRLQDVSGQLNSVKKPSKSKGEPRTSSFCSGAPWMSDLL